MGAGGGPGGIRPSILRVRDSFQPSSKQVVVVGPVGFEPTNRGTNDLLLLVDLISSSF